MWTREQLQPLARKEPNKLVELVLALQKRVQQLEAHLTLNSRNSSKPPSSDGYTKPAPKSERPKSNRKSGGQPGHNGNTLKPVKNPDHIIPHPLDICPCGCGGSLRNQPVLRYESRQVFDLPPLRLEVTEHRAEVKVCPRSGQEVCAPFPPGVAAPAQYSPRFLAWLVYCRVQQLLPLERIRQMCQDLFGQTLSTGTIQSACENTETRLLPFQSTVERLLRQAAVAHADETGLRVAGKLHWLHVLSTRLLTWYGVHTKRGNEAIEDFGLLLSFQGRLIHDCWSAYLGLKCKHGFCCAHLLRELTFLFEQLHQAWAGKLHDLFLDMHRFVAQQKAKRVSCLSPPQLASWRRRYNALITKGRTANPQPPAPKKRRRGRLKKSKPLNLLDRMEHHADSILAFLYDFRVPFSNNIAEQDIRMTKVQQKISGCFRTLEGAHTFAHVRSYISTLRKNHQDILAATADALCGRPFIPAFAD